MLLNNDIKASAFQPCVTLSTRETGKAIYLGGKKGRRENVFSWLSSQLGFGSSGQTTKPAPRASVPRSGPCAAYAFQALQTHFQVSAALPVGKEASGVYQHRRGAPCWGHPAEGTWHLPWACHAGVTQPRAPGTSHGRAMLGSPSRGHLAPPMGVPCWGHLAKSTWHLPWAPGEEWQAQPWLAKNRSREHS